MSDGDRTHGHWSHNPALYQLSYAHQNNRTNHFLTSQLLPVSAVVEPCDSSIILPKLGSLATAACLYSDEMCLWGKVTSRLGTHRNRSGRDQTTTTIRIREAIIEDPPADFVSDGRVVNVAAKHSPCPVCRHGRFRRVDATGVGRVAPRR